MKIALVAPLFISLPPIKYGGIERDVVELAIRLGKRGHQVTIFAAGGSHIDATGVRIISSSPYPIDLHKEESKKWEISQALQVMSLQNYFDIINFYYEPFILNHSIDGIEYNFLEYFIVPIVSNFHNNTYIDKHLDYYKTHKSIWNIPCTFLSKNHLKPLHYFKHTQIIPNGIPVDEFAFNNNPQDYLVFLGRITPVKGILEAIKVAKLANKKLIIAAKIDEDDQDYYETKVKPHIDGKQVVYIGEVGMQDKVDLLKNAQCLLFPIQWNEPFGLVLVESMACGTPVIALNRGAVPEIVSDGETGFVVDTTKEMVKAIDKIPHIDRQACRKRVETLFNVDQMVDKYETLFQQILQSRKIVDQSAIISSIKVPQVKL